MQGLTAVAQELCVNGVSAGGFAGPIDVCAVARGSFESSPSSATTTADVVVRAAGAGVVWGTVGPTASFNPDVLIGRSGPEVSAAESPSESVLIVAGFAATAAVFLVPRACRFAGSVAFGPFSSSEDASEISSYSTVPSL